MGRARAEGQEPILDGLDRRARRPLFLGFVEVETATAFAGPSGAEIQEGSNRVASLDVIVMCREIGRISRSTRSNEKSEMRRLQNDQRIERKSPKLSNIARFSPDAYQRDAVSNLIVLERRPPIHNLLSRVTGTMS